MGYDIYDTGTANLVESFRTEQEALDVVRRVVGESGAAAVLSWSLGRSDHCGKALSGQALIDRAYRVASA